MSKYCNKTVDEICRLLENGLYQKDTALAVGIDESTFYRWKKENKSFASRISQSIVKYKLKLIACINRQCEEKDGRLALEVLARRWPDQFSEKLKFEIQSGENIRSLNDLLSLVRDQNDKKQLEGEKNE